MKDREEIRKLLGGYATGTLTPEEQQALFAAALTDQELFDELAREQSLRDLLHEPAARAHVLASIEERRAPWYQRFWRPAGVIVAAAFLLSVGIYVAQRKPHSAPQPQMVAMLKDQAPAPVTPRDVPMPEPKAAPALPAPPVARKPRVEATNRPARTESAKADAVAEEPRVVTGAPLLAASPAAAPPPAPTAPVPAQKSEALDSLVANGSVSAGLQSAYFNGGTQPISLQNAQQMFYQNFAGDKKKAAAPGARALPMMAATLVPPRLGIKWTILRQRDGGEFTEVDPADVHAGDSVKIRLIPNEDGFLSVWEGGKALLASTAVQRLTPQETPVITSAAPANRLLTVQFTREPGDAAPARDAGVKQSASDSAEHATYVLISKDSPATPASLVIPLRFQ